MCCQYFLKVSSIWLLVIPVIFFQLGLGHPDIVFLLTSHESHMTPKRPLTSVLLVFLSGHRGSAPPLFQCFWNFLKISWLTFHPNSKLITSAVKYLWFDKVWQHMSKSIAVQSNLLLYWKVGHTAVQFNWDGSLQVIFPKWKCKMNDTLSTRGKVSAICKVKIAFDEQIRLICKAHYYQQPQLLLL